jgi:hypothetical protein
MSWDEDDSIASVDMKREHYAIVLRDGVTCVEVHAQRR